MCRLFALPALLLAFLPACSADTSTTPEPSDLDQDSGILPPPDGSAEPDASETSSPDAEPAETSTEASVEAGVEAGPDAIGPTPAATCGNGRLDPQEGCDGELFPEGLSTCDDNNLGTGTTVCTAACTLDVSGCQDKNYCAGLFFYNDDQCDACEWMGGDPDVACAIHCSADSVCADWYDPAVGQWSCLAAGYGADPDCGVCGNGKVEGHEKCDGDAYAVFQGIQLDTCEVWSYQGGTLKCLPNCLPDFSGCN